jgi:acyl phosphate:glycerol-3-phosphate acyltransferase
VEYVAACVIGYLLGSVPVALLVARRHGVDLRATADGNPGAWNALDQLGPRRALPAFVGDGLKGSLAAAAGLAIGGIWVGYAAAAAAMAGHALPLFARFRGGKSVMTFVGAAFVLAPLAAAICAVACIAVSLATRSFAIGVRVAVFGFPVVQLATDPVERVAATGGLMTMIGVLFALRRRSVPATSGPGAPPTTSAAP